MRRINTILFLLVLSPLSSWAAVEVVEIGQNLFVNTLTAVRTFDQLQEQLRDLASLESFPTEGIAKDLAEILAVIDEMQGLLPFDPSQISHAFDTLYPSGAAVPCTSADLQAWRVSSREQIRLAAKDSARAQSLLGRLSLLAERMLGVLQQVFATGGSVRGLQTTGQDLALLLQEQTRLNTINGTFQRVMTSREAAAVTEEAAIACITAAVRADHPR
jgi:conjugal transfer/entry exclusion protein